MARSNDKRPDTDIDIVFKEAEEAPKQPRPNYYRITVERGDGEVCSVSEAALILTASAHKLYEKSEKSE